MGYLIRDPDHAHFGVVSIIFRLRHTMINLATYTKFEVYLRRLRKCVKWRKCRISGGLW